LLPFAAFATRTASADPVGRVAVGTRDEALREALSVAFFAKGFEIVETRDALLEREALDEVRSSAREIDAAAVIWLCKPTSGERSFCLYNRKDDALIRRPLATEPPLSPAQAASVALTVKAFLMSGPQAAATEEQRLDAEIPALVTAPRPPPSDAPFLTVEAQGGGRYWPVGVEDLGARVSVAAAYFPRKFERRLGAGLALQAGPDVSGVLDRMNVASSHVGDLALEAFGRARTKLSRVWLEVDLGPAIHFLTVDGGLHESRTGWSLDGDVRLIVPLGSFFGGVRAGAFVMLLDDPLGHKVLEESVAQVGADAGFLFGYGFR
jgi:hypothetical protein